MEWKSASGKHVLLVVHSHQALCSPSWLPSDAVRCLQLPRPYLPFSALSKYLLYKLFPPFSVLLLHSLDNFLDCTGALEFHISHLSIFAFVVCALGFRATEPCLGALFCSQFLYSSCFLRSIVTYFFQHFQSKKCSVMWTLIQDVVATLLCAQLSRESPNPKSFPRSPVSLACVLFLLCVFPSLLTMLSFLKRAHMHEKKMSWNLVSSTSALHTCCTVYQDVLLRTGNAFLLAFERILSVISITCC